MIKLEISENLKAHLDIKERLESLSLAREVTINNDLKEARLQHSGKTYIGSEEINSYLNDFESFHTQWYNCHCG